MTETIGTVTSIGSHALRILTNAEAASVLGVTSRGVFLRIPERRVIFLSYETDRGPLTLNLSPNTKSPANIHPGQLVDIRDQNIVFSTSNFHIRTAGAATWIVPPHPRIDSTPAEMMQRIRVIGENLIGKRGGAGLTPILAQLLHIPINQDLNQNKYNGQIDHQRFHKNITSFDTKHVLSQFQKFLGYGEGLTPSGDDLIGGFLLAYNRYQDALPIPFNLAEVNQAIVELAYQKTSLLSANLIACAAIGQSDERLILALDGILAGTMRPASCADQLLRWGNSSGCDAFLGMALAIIPPHEGSLANRE